MTDALASDILNLILKLVYFSFVEEYDPTIGMFCDYISFKCLHASMKCYFNDSLDVVKMIKIVPIQCYTLVVSKNHVFTVKKRYCMTCTFAG